MVLRACAYRDCENYILDGARTSKFTLFQFPKNPERFERWLELGQAPTNLPISSYQYCSDHFDSKYFSQNGRRLVLVGSAEPFPYVKDALDINTTNDFQICDDNGDAVGYELTEDCQDNEQEPDIRVVSNVQEHEDDNIMKANETKRDNNLPGEEYVQMSKEHYVNEKTPSVSYCPAKQPLDINEQIKIEVILKFFPILQVFELGFARHCTNSNSTCHRSFCCSSDSMAAIKIIGEV
uniref:THAP-type domain-containing protein n=1 Tax=Glossina brevipalpis TaxID=37001 RepID=A0A1A9WJD4_9MUSC